MKVFSLCQRPNIKRIIIKMFINRLINKKAKEFRKVENKNKKIDHAEKDYLKNFT